MTHLPHSLARLLPVVIVASTMNGARADEPKSNDRDQEIALALEAAPAALGAKAGVYVHDKSGYIKVRDSQNGFVCLVDHRIPNAVEPEIRQAIKAAFSSRKLKAPRRPGIIYMLSPHNIVTIDEEKGVAVPFPGHLMFYAPNMTSSDVGSDGSPASPVFVVDEKTPHALMIVPVPVGAAAPGHAHPTH
jgi:hypothetical protein